jgi:hypothetical protein
MLQKKTIELPECLKRPGPMTGACLFNSSFSNKGEFSMNIFEIGIRIALVLVVLYLLNQLYIVVVAFRWRSQDKLIARALEKYDA